MYYKIESIAYTRRLMERKFKISDIQGSYTTKKRTEKQTQRETVLKQLLGTTKKTRKQRHTKTD